MAYIVELTTDSRCSEVATAIENRATAEGFSLEIIRASRRIQLRRVRRRSRGSRRGLYLSKEQWARFNQLVNEALDEARVVANVWSTPFDVKGRYWIRRRDRWEVPRRLDAEA